MKIFIPFTILNHIVFTFCFEGPNTNHPGSLSWFSPTAIDQDSFICLPFKVLRLPSQFFSDILQKQIAEDISNLLQLSVLQA